MRERANEVEQLKRQLKTYEEFHQHTTQDKDCIYQQSSSPLILHAPSNKRGAGDWYPPQQATLPVAPGKERYHVSFPNDSQFSRAQGQVCPTEMEQQSANSPRPATRHRMECWTPTNSRRTATESPTPASSLPIEDGLKSDDILLLSPVDLSSMTDDFTFDTAKMVNESRQLTSLLHMAVAGNHIDTIKVLLQDERIMIDEKDGDGFTPLQRAVMHGRSEIVKLLLEHTAT